jgi:hypothetical protein
MTGDQTGSAVLPEVDTPVLVVSLDRYRTKMIASGALYTEKHRPPKTEENSDADLNQDGKNSLRFIITIETDKDVSITDIHGRVGTTERGTGDTLYPVIRSRG